LKINIKGPRLTVKEHERGFESTRGEGERDLNG